MFIIMQTVQPLDALSWKALALVSISAVSLSDPTSLSIMPSTHPRYTSKDKQPPHQSVFELDCSHGPLSNI